MELNFVTMKIVVKKENKLLAQMDEACAFIRGQVKSQPRTAIVLGTGLGNLTTFVKDIREIDYSAIPYFPESTVESHVGKLVFGKLNNRDIVLMQGRFHIYEGYSAQEVTFPIRVLKGLGVENLIVTNAAGGLNLAYRKGEIVLIEDHINMMGVNPLIGSNDERVGPRFPDMSEPYAARLIGLAEESARDLGVSIRRGVYLGVTGPCLETRAEYRMMRQFGADLVGMSTIPEVIAAVHVGLKVLGISIVTDLCDPDHLLPVDIKEIIKIAGEAGPKLDKLISRVIEKI